MARKSSLVEIAYETIKDKIISYSLPPGTALSDNQLALELGMSRAPVREAILRLAGTGLADDDEIDGKIVVSPIGLTDIVDILQVRRALESQAVHIIADKGWFEPQWEKQYTELYTRLLSLAKAATASAAAVAEYNQCDGEFHSAIITLCGNRRMAQITRNMGLQMQRARWLNVAVPSRVQETSPEHTEIYEALLDKDRERAAAAVEAHLRSSERTYRAVFNDPILKQIMTGIYNFLK